MSLQREKLYTNEWIPDVKEHSLLKIISSTVAMVRAMINAKTWYNKKVDINYDFFYKWIMVKIDKFALIEVFINLITNAVKYSYEGSPVEIIFLKNGIIQIKNKGIGVADDEIDKIFNLGYQSPRAIEYGKEFDEPGDELKNTVIIDGFRNKGMGLYIAKRLLKVMGGDLYLVSQGIKKEEYTIFEINVEKLIKKYT